MHAPAAASGNPVNPVGYVSVQASPGFRLYSSWQLRLELAKHAAAAVEYMHSQNILHRDLTSYNLLVTDKFEAKASSPPDSGNPPGR